MNDFLEALRFLTILPLPPAKTQKPDALARAMLFFPLVGFSIASVSLGIYVLVSGYLPEKLGILLLLALPILLSGGLHADGFADFCDGFFGGKDKAQILRIMKDSRIGTFGVVGLVLLLLTKMELLQALPSKAIPYLIALTASRWMQVALSFYLPSAREQADLTPLHGTPSGGGLVEAVARKVGRLELLGASGFLFAVMLLLVPGMGPLLFAGLVGLLLALAVFYKKKLGGITGDMLGAASEMTEVVVLLVMIYAR